MHGPTRVFWANLTPFSLKPEGVYHSGSAFGDGIYFADQFAKSAAYCSYHGNVGFMLLCEVECGRALKVDAPTGAGVDLAPEGEGAYHSVHAVASHAPDPERSVFHPDGFQIPLGPLVPSALRTTAEERAAAKTAGAPAGGAPAAVPETPEKNRRMLRQSEYVVFKAEQVRIRYVLELRTAADSAEAGWTKAKAEGEQGQEGEEEEEEEEEEREDEEEEDENNDDY
jgi:hypothetical protein